MSHRNVPQESIACNKRGNAKFFNAEKMVRGINNCTGETEEWSEERKEKRNWKKKKKENKQIKGNMWERILCSEGQANFIGSESY